MIILHHYQSRSTGALHKSQNTVSRLLAWFWAHWLHSGLLFVAENASLILKIVSAILMHDLFVQRQNNCISNQKQCGTQSLWIKWKCVGNIHLRPCRGSSDSALQKTCWPCVACRLICDAGVNIGRVSPMGYPKESIWQMYETIFPKVLKSLNLVLNSMRLYYILNLNKNQNTLNIQNIQWNCYIVGRSKSEGSSKDYSWSPADNTLERQDVIRV